MKRIAIVAPYFPPNNLTGVHRSRFLASHLKHFGWEPVVLTVRSEYYEENLDERLEALLPRDLKIIRTKAFGTKPFRIVGDVSIRCFLWQWAKLRRLAKAKEIDFIFISLFPAYSTLLGRLIYEEFKIPYGIDYQDPWVEYRTVKRKLLSKDWFSQKLARWLEPIAVKKTCLITGVAESYYEGVVSRHAHLTDVAKLVMPIGIDPSDHEAVSQTNMRPFLFEPQEDNFNLVYAGTILPGAREVWHAFFQGLKDLKGETPEIFRRLKVRCIGTGSAAAGPIAHIIRPLAEFYGLYGNAVFEYPVRIPYLDVLCHLNAANGILVIGSTEKHYTASKLYQAVFSKKPVFAIVHEASTAAKFLKESNASIPMTFNGREDLPNVRRDIVKRIRSMLGETFDVSSVDYSYFDPFTACAQAKQLAQTLDRIVI